MIEIQSIPASPCDLPSRLRTVDFSVGRRDCVVLYYFGDFFQYFVLRSLLIHHRTLTHNSSDFYITQFTPISTFNIADIRPSRDIPRKTSGFYGNEDNLSLSLRYLIYLYFDPILQGHMFTIYMQIRSRSTILFMQS
jgi:hypothetical protein